MSILPSSPGIYKITCLSTDKVYIGSTISLRKRKGWHWGDLRVGRHHNRYLQNAWNKYGESAFTFTILELVMFVEHLDAREQYWMDYHQSSNPQKGFNAGKAARAPMLGRPVSEETRQKLRKSSKERISLEHLAAMREQASVWHGSAEGRRWHGKHARHFWDSQDPRVQVCAHCGQSYKTRANNDVSRFCSARCKNRARQAARLDHEERQCTICGALFACKKYYSTRCCSQSCASKLRWREKREVYTSAGADQPRIVALRQFWAARQPKQRQCGHCGAVYETICTHTRALFCSDRCKGLARGVKLRKLREEG